MKLLVAFFFTGLLAVSASTYSQQTKLSMNLDEVTVKEVFIQIEEKSEFVFFYNEDYIDVNRKVSINVQDEKVESILNELLKGTNNTFKIYDRQIVILSPNMKELPVQIKQQPQKKNPGSLEGFIKDAATGEVLPFATFFFVGTTNGCLSNDKGFYSLRSIMPGNYKMKVSYVGYKDTIVDVHIMDNNVIVKNIELGFASTMAQEVIITAQAYGQIKAINTQISSQTIKNVVSEQKIKELPDANAAEALSHLPGVSIEREGGEATNIKIRGVGSNTIYVNGMRMYGGLGSVSSSMIGGIELSKAFMPDQDADVLGGSVEFKMREAPSGFNKTIELRQGYNNFTKSFKNHDAIFTLSNRFFKDKLGVMLSFNYDQKDRGRDMLGATYLSIGSSTGSGDILPVKLNSVALTHYQNLNDRYGVTIFTDYRLKNGRIFYQGFFSKLDQVNKYSDNNYQLSFGGIAYSSTQSTVNDYSSMNGIGGEYTLLGAKIDWGVSLSNAKKVTDLLVLNGANQAGMVVSSPIDSTTTIKQFVGFGHNDMTWTQAGNIMKQYEENYTDELAYKLNIELPFKLGNHIAGYLKFGGKVRDIDRGYSNYAPFSSFSNVSYQQLAKPAVERLPNYGWTYTPGGNQLTLEAFLGPQSTWTQNFSMLGLKTYYFPDFNKVKYVESVLDDKLALSLNTMGGDYANNEHFYAGYIMAGIDIGKLITFTPGVRYEKDTYSTTAKWVQTIIDSGPLSNQGIIKDTTDGFHNEHFFPMVQLKIKPLKWFDIRLAYTKTVSRPDFGDMSPKYYRDPLFNISKGNMLLRPQSNTNYDIYFSFYGNKLGLFTAGAFYKEMKDQVTGYTIVILDPADYGLSSGYKNKNYTVPMNNQWPGYIKGVEFDWQTQFAYLPKPFNCIILNANVTYMQSDTKYPFFTFQRVPVVDENGKPKPPYFKNIGQNNSRSNKITGMPDMMGNIALGYEVGGFSGRISAYYQSLTLWSTQAIDLSVNDQDKAMLMRFDLQLSQKIKKVEGLTVYLNINNLTNNQDKTVLSHYPDRIISDERYGASGDIGVRYRF